VAADTAADAAAGWNCSWRQQQSRPYDVAVLDMSLPDVNGLELAGRC
jgi:DNA-binding response OmpR family regulator